ncbi:MAG TPA: nucleotide disphospho-sugar-binding domain-containing protein [Thermomicrobiales bacterium]|nr:nucleotide disphospho-sugar-binding domain-containing protein [Thermomicrobiales bacterium]
MRVLATLQPGLGHFHPLIPLARLLADRGHEVVFACSAAFGPTVAAAGFQSVPAGIDWLSAEIESAFPAIRDIPPGPARYAWGRQHLFADITARAMVPDLLDFARQWQPAVIVRDAAEYGGYLAAEVLDLPHAVVRTDSGSAAFAARGDVAAPLTAARAALGLPPDPDVIGPFRYLGLSFAGPLDDPAILDAPTTHRLRPGVETADELDAGIPWPGQLPARPLVYGTLGTVYNRLTNIFDAIMAGLRDADINLLLTIGHSLDPAQFGPQPGHIRIERYIPQATLLPACDLVLTHGGYGTVSAALAHGLPLVMLPISADQPQNARRCVTLGVGQMLGPDERTPEAIRNAVQSVLTDPSYRARSVAVRETIERLPDIATGVALLERLAHERRPLVAADPGGN